MSSALTFFLADALSRRVSASVHGRVTSPSPSALGVPAASRRLAEKLFANEISRSPEVCCSGPAPEEACERSLGASQPYVLALAVSSPSFLRLRQIEAVLAEFGRPLSEAVSTLGAFFGRGRRVDNFLDRLRGELLSAQTPARLADGPCWRLDLQPQLDQAAV
jgi:hypothetical protein